MHSAYFRPLKGNFPLKFSNSPKMLRDVINYILMQNSPSKFVSPQPSVAILGYNTGCTKV